MLPFLILVAIHIMLGICAYLLLKKDHDKDGYDWTRGDRFFALMVSAMGGIGLVIAIVCYFLNDDGPAGW